MHFWTSLPKAAQIARISDFMKKMSNLEMSINQNTKLQCQIANANQEMSNVKMSI